ncbi:MAG: tripartite tricarboxylate transporter substrate binding protein [Xanthobacteraceae bacterium]|nr:tripartite tricarboxylate transporter substrate binding protein [Xanthobacteraceae bacterium]MBX9843561.1 tripartite tricarboxylate transporter substrate binding protein [Xanthobacteraceae bacterium]
MRTTIVLACTAAAWLAAAPAASAQGDSYPSRPITIIVPFPPGGSSDVVTRIVAQKLADNLKANVVIDNRGGGGGAPGAIAAKQAAPDGYTLLLANNGLFAILPALTPNINFDPLKDFQPITPIVTFPSVLVVPDASPARNVKDLVALAKSKPGGLNFASQGVGSGGHILGEMLRLNSGAPFTHVPYRGAGPAVSDLAAGNVDLLFSSYVSAIGQVQAGKLRVLGWTATKRAAALPDVPTMAEAGFPGTELEIWHGIVAPAGTPAPIVRKLNEEIIKAAKSPEVLSKVAPQAVEMSTLSPAEFAKLIATDIDVLGKVIRDAGIKAQ